MDGALFRDAVPQPCLTRTTARCHSRFRLTLIWCRRPLFGSTRISFGLEMAYWSNSLVWYSDDLLLALGFLVFGKPESDTFPAIVASNRSRVASVAIAGVGTNVS